MHNFRIKRLKYKFKANFNLFLSTFILPISSSYLKTLSHHWRYKSRIFGHFGNWPAKTRNILFLLLLLVHCTFLTELFHFFQELFSLSLFECRSLFLTNQKSVTLWFLLMRVLLKAGAWTEKTDFVRLSTAKHLYVDWKFFFDKSFPF